MIKNRMRVVLLINLGTPSEATPYAVRKYLAEFLSDPRVVELPAWLWKPILYTIVLPTRSKRLAKLYQSIWLDEGSPLAVYSKKLAERVQTQLGDFYKVVLAMRYGRPSIKDVLTDLLARNAIDSLIVLPLYPQYSAATTASCFDVVSNIVKKQRFIPFLTFNSSYFDQDFYIKALAEKIRGYWEREGTKDYLLFSFHGLPKYCSKLGDPYEQQCYKTVNLLASELDLSPDQYQLVFQSRFGKAEWLQPYCDVVLQELPSQGIKRVAVICPGFAVDCLETLEEISKRYRELFLKLGGESFNYIPALNASSEHSSLLVSLIHKLFEH
ncbi:MAG: ferrochelatase [Rickettsiella sp.]|nr:ferrochelatase [Rickettsiella sp.]